MIQIRFEDFFSFPWEVALFPRTVTLLAHSKRLKPLDRKIDALSFQYESTPGIGRASQLVTRIFSFGSKRMLSTSTSRRFGLHRPWMPAALLFVGGASSAFVSTSNTLHSPSKIGKPSSVAGARTGEDPRSAHRRYLASPSALQMDAAAASSNAMAEIEAGSSSPSVLSAFLQQSRERTLSAGSRVHAYIGNEASDADSMCSAICMALLEHEVRRGTEGSVGQAPAPAKDTSRSSDDFVHVPGEES